MKADDFRSLNLEELDARIVELQKNLFNYRMQLHSSQLTNVNALRTTRKDIARALTVQQERLFQAGEKE